ncbi:MAG: peptidylprolyl isomerase [Gammaproteobacteria bacterium]|nr:peptidylprolyl isomerase [Gammaproteobacteria bacterium]
MSILTFNICNADTVVRFNIQQGVVLNTVDLKLYDADTPLTVSNFMSYVNDGSYDNSFIHRSVSNFIIQGGGYKYDPSISDIAGSLSLVLKKDPILNEPGISNLRGTIAMAKVDGDPNSATSQWFFNLADNSANLDGQNGGFTVFGEVINNGMQVIDSISFIPIYDVGCLLSFGCLSEIPLLDYNPPPALISSFVKITKVEGLVKISSDYDFGAVESNAYQQSDFIIENISAQNLSIGNIGSSDPIMPPFGINDTGCNNTTLLPGASCVFAVSFSPVAINSFIDSFNIEFPGLGFDYTVNVSGDGVLSLADYDSDGDGVSDLIESSGPNGGDGNHDDVLDSTQSNVVSIASGNGVYVTLTGSSFINYSGVHFVDKAAIPNTPGNVANQVDVIGFSLNSLQQDQNVQIGMYLPATLNPESFYIYGPIDIAAQPSWFEFILDANTGTGSEIISDFTFTADNGDLITNTLVTLYLKNAARGDSTFDLDNEIKVVGAFHDSLNSSSSGQLHPIVLCILFLSMIGRRLKILYN